MDNRDALGRYTTGRWPRYCDCLTYTPDPGTQQKAS